MAGVYGKRKRASDGMRKVFKKRRTVSRSGRRLGAYASRFSYKRPARLRGSRVQYALNRAVGRVLNGIAENKLISVTAQNEVAAIPIQALAQAHYQSFVVGGRPTTWDSNMNNLAGTTLAQGTADGNRIGDSVYMRKTHLTIEIDCPPTTDTSSINQVPKEFRMIIVKSRRANDPAGVTPVPQTTLFLNTVGEKIGYQTSGVNGSDLMMQPVNKRLWSVFADRRFTLTNPAVTPSTTVGAGIVMVNQKYGSKKTFRVNLPYYSKVHYDNTNLPTDLDCHYAVFIFARSIGRDYNADGWEVNIRGTTSYKDM